MRIIVIISYPYLSVIRRIKIRFALINVIADLLSGL